MAGPETIHRLRINGDLELDGLGDLAAGSGDDHIGGGGRRATAAAAAGELRGCDYAGDQHKGQEKCTPLPPSQEAESDRECGSLGKERVGTALESSTAALGQRQGGRSVLAVARRYRCRVEAASEVGWHGRASERRGGVKPILRRYGNVDDAR